MRSPKTFSQNSPIVNSQLSLDDWRMYSTPTSAQPISIRPKGLRGRRRSQYTPVNAGPMTKSAFCAASHSG